MAKTHVKVKLVYQDVGYCREYYKVTEGKNKHIILCALETDPEPSDWHTVSDNEIEGEPGFPLDMERFSVEVVTPEKV